MSGRSLSVQKCLTKEEITEFRIENPNISVERSVEMVKKLTVAALSGIIFRRKIFPESAFSTKNFKGLQIKVLKGISQVPGSLTLINWLKSAFDLIKAHHLKKLILVVEASTGNVTLETYTFRYDYNLKNIATFTVDDQNGASVELDTSSPVDIISKAHRMMDAVDVITEKLKPLPLDSEFSLRLELNDTTPENFALPHSFKMINSYDINFPKEIKPLENLKLGEVSSNFTFIALATKSVFYQEESELTDEEIVPASQEFNEQILSIPLSKSNTHQLDPNSCQLDTNPHQLGTNLHQLGTNLHQLDTNQHSNENTEENSLNSSVLSNQMCSVSLKDKEIKCICACANDYMSETVECASCFTHQHKACYKLLNDQPITDHICINCHDPKLNNICSAIEAISEENMKELAIYRKALALCLQHAQVSRHKIMTYLRVNREAATKIIDQLEAEGCISSSPGRSYSKNVRIEHLKENILGKYFNQVNNKNCDIMEIDPPSPDNYEVNKIDSRKRSYSKNKEDIEYQEIKKRARRVLKTKLIRYDN